MMKSETSGGPGRYVALLALLATTITGACSPEASLAEGDEAQLEAPEFPAANRPDVRGTHGAVSAGHPLAARAGMAVLERGGNAVDAALAMAGVLAVVRPHMNGVGGDAFALFYEAESGRVVGLNASGPAGALATPSFFTDAGEASVPERGPMAVSVPGAVGGWIAAHERYGTLPLPELLAPAIDYARNGFPVSQRLARDISVGASVLNEPAAALYTPGGDPPTLGSLLRNPALAETLEEIAAQGTAGFYEGAVAARLDAFVSAQGGYLRAADLAAYEPEWVEPLTVDYLGYTFNVIPPNSQGLAHLQMMEMSKSYDYMALGHNTSPYLHTMIELKKLAFADRDRWVADLRHADVPVDELLDAAYLEGRAGMVGEQAAQDVAPGIGSQGRVADDGGLDDSGDTVYLTAVDAQGNAVSWIQSLFAAFGSGLLEPETGVVLHNRGALFTLEEGHPNQVAPGKRPYHTLTPTLATREGALGFTLGTPGGDSQPQSLLQITNNLLLFGLTPQEAIEAPRFRSYNSLAVAIEDRVTPEVRRELTARGHELEVIHGWTATFGGAQMIHVDPVSGTLTAASDPRREAYAVAY
jgi:gamma-glutamyltranspeptidase/glutathione hydrolase